MSKHRATRGVQSHRGVVDARCACAYTVKYQLAADVTNDH